MLKVVSHLLQDSDFICPIISKTPFRFAGKRYYVLRTENNVTLNYSPSSTFKDAQKKWKSSSPLNPSHEIRTEQSSFKSTGLCDQVLTALAQSHPHVLHPTPIQAASISRLLKNKSDPYILAAQTGSGKTLSYLLVVIDRLVEDELLHKVTRRESRPRALILAPNRELAVQICKVAKSLSHYVKFRTVLLCGGAKLKPQKTSLRSPIDILVATPGRLLQHYHRERVYFSDVRDVVVDEADTMLTKDFENDLDKIFLPILNRNLERTNYCRPTQFIFVGATFPPETEAKILHKFKTTKKVATHLHHISNKIKYEFIRINQSSSRDKFGPLIEVIAQNQGAKTIIFCNTIQSCRATEHLLREHSFGKVSCYHGDILPKQREANWTGFVSGKSDILVCTDIAARGLDTMMVEHVVVFDFPTTASDFIHRVGRTGRTGKSGKVTSFFTRKDSKLVDIIQKSLSQKTAIEERLSPKSKQHTES